MSDKSEKIVHILSGGGSLCRMPGVPKNWPEGHFWVGFSMAQDATCRTCKQAFTSGHPGGTVQP